MIKNVLLSIALVWVLAWIDYGFQPIDHTDVKEYFTHILTPLDGWNVRLP